MARLVIGNDFITFLHSQRFYTAHITRLILEDSVIYNIFYNCHDSNEEGKCEISFSDDGKKLSWKSHTKNLSEDFIDSIGKEIEKKRELFAVTA
jgi:hypothetical protein